MKLKIISFLSILSLFVASPIVAQEGNGPDLEGINRQVENNQELARQLTQFNVSRHLGSVADIVAFLSERNPELTCNICLGALHALDDPDEDTVRAILEAAFAANPQQAPQVGQCVASVYEDWEPLVSLILVEMGIEDVDTDVPPQVLPQAPSEEGAPDFVTPVDAPVPSPSN